MFATEHLSYDQTGAFSKIVLHYLEGEESLKSFYAVPPTIEGIRQAIANKATQTVDREALVEVLKKQYGELANETVASNIESLVLPQTFTVCTAHQPNLFSGPLYFIYKILHAIKLAAHLKKEFPEQHFVPVFYMGSEDADLAELNHFTIAGKKYVWNTAQTGAVGRMTVDNELVSLIDEAELQLGVAPFGNAFCQLLRQHYTTGSTIQQATFQFVNSLFADYGLVVLIADDEKLKRQMVSVFEADLFTNKPSEIVEATCRRLAESYKVQASPRSINLFYLNGNVRERIEREGDDYIVVNTGQKFTEASLRHELVQHPERFSPNVILRGIFQETILPNVAFIGGGGELAYWLQLQDLFLHYSVPFPALVLRDSLTIMEAADGLLLEKLGLATTQLFQPKQQILNTLLEAKGKLIKLDDDLLKLSEWFDNVKEKAATADVSLREHVAALKAKTETNIRQLQKKLQRSERKKLEAETRQLDRLQDALFPNGSLQERVENVGGFYAKWGPDFIKYLYENILPIESKFVVLKEKSGNPK